MTKKYTEDFSPLLDSDFARTSRHLRFMTALFEIGDPELEQALVVLLEHLASRTLGSAPPPPFNPKARRRRKLPEASRPCPKQ